MQNFDEHETCKIVTVNGMNYQVEKFSAIVGVKVMKLLLSKIQALMPLITSMADENDIKDSAVFDLIFKVLDDVTDEELDKLMRWSLHATKALLPAGPQPIILASGSYGVPGIESNLALCLRLTGEAIAWNLKGFFDDSQSAFGDMEGLASLLRGLPISTNSSSPQS